MATCEKLHLSSSSFEVCRPVRSALSTKTQRHFLESEAVLELIELDTNSKTGTVILNTAFA